MEEANRQQKKCNPCPQDPAYRITCPNTIQTEGKGVESARLVSKKIP